MLIGKKTWPPGGEAILPYGYSENLKYPLLRKCQADFQIILQKHSLGDTLQDSFKPWWLVKNMATRGLFGDLTFALWPWSDTGPLGPLVENIATKEEIAQYVQFLL